jgi:hypothetical protein
MNRFVQTLCAVLLLSATGAASANAQTAGDNNVVLPALTVTVDRSAVDRHRALGRLPGPSHRHCLEGQTVTVDQAAERRHRALGRLPNVVATSARPVKAMVEKSGFDWGDASIGFGVGIAVLGFGLALASRLGRRSTPPLPKP